MYMQHALYMQHAFEITFKIRTNVRNNVQAEFEITFKIYLRNVLSAAFVGQRCCQVLSYCRDSCMAATVSTYIERCLLLDLKSYNLFLNSQSDCQSL
jgi:hypothetical protein